MEMIQKIAGSKNDEYYTPAYAVRPILNYIKADSTVWCPFDTKDSYFVKELEAAGHKVIATHIWNGQDFFTMNVPECDYIISNPPYSTKTEVLQRLFKIGKPFAMLLGVNGMFDNRYRFEMFSTNEFEMLYVNKRISFFKSYEEEKPSVNPAFQSVYICSKMLPKQICFERIVKE